MISYESEGPGPSGSRSDVHAEVKLAGINPYVDVPERIMKSLGVRPKTAVLVKIAAADHVKREPSRK